MTWLKFDKKNKLTVKLLCDHVICPDYDITSAAYEVIAHYLRHLAYNFMGFVIQTLQKVSLNKYKLKP